MRVCKSSSTLVFFLTAFGVDAKVQVVTDAKAAADAKVVPDAAKIIASNHSGQGC